MLLRTTDWRGTYSVNIRIVFRLKLLPFLLLPFFILCENMHWKGPRRQPVGWGQDTCSSAHEVNGLHPNLEGERVRVGIWVGILSVSHPHPQLTILL